jgi:ribosomal 50S subunit-recycling heat shock protein
VSGETLAELGWSPAEAARVLRALGFIPAGTPKGGAALWRRRGPFRRPPETDPAPPAETVAGESEPCRIDVWLWRARFCKTRAQAAKRVADGEVAGTRQGAPIALDKPSRHIRPGDVLTLAMGGRNAALRVQAIGERRGPAAEARQLYTLLSPA